MARRFWSFGSGVWPTALGVYAAAGGAISLAGWALDHPRLTDWFGLGISIQPNTALAAALAGAGLLCLQAGARRAAAMLGGAVALIGAGVIAENAAGVSFGIDTPLMFGRLWGHTAVVADGRMGSPSAVSWTMIGVAMIVVAERARRLRARGFAGVFVTLTIAISWLSLIGYLFGAGALYSIPQATAIALQTSTFVMAAAVGLTLSMPGYGPARLLVEESASGEMLRRTLPAIVFVPVVLGYFWVGGERLGYFDFPFGAAAGTLAEIVLLLALIWWTAGSVSRAEHERRQAEAKLLANQALLHTVTEEAEVGLVIVDRDHRYLYANRAYCEIVHANQAEIIGRHVSEVLPDVYESRIRPKVDAAFSGETVRYELDLPERGQFVSITYQPQWKAGVVESVIVAIVDTTARRRIEDELHESQLQLRAAAARKDQFLMTLSHELRNPLAAIRTASDTLQRSTDPPAVARALNVIDRQLTLTARLLDDLLDISRLSSGELTLQPTPLDLATVVGDAIDVAQPVASQYRQTLDVTLPGSPLMISADPARVEQIVANLLNNACRFSRPNGTVHVSLERRGDRARLAVSDQGIGIESKNLVRIFERFSQVDRSISRERGGLGVGLHMVKGLVELHGGTVEARSAGLGLGSEFIVEFPALAETAVAAASPTSPKSRAAQPPRRILIVDDNVDAATGMSMLLTIGGHETHVAHDGVSALDAYARLRPEVVLLDIGLPIMSGLDVCRKMRALPSDAPALIIALTGWGTDADRQQSRDAGFDHHLVKPVDYDSLTTLLAASQR